MAPTPRQQNRIETTDRIKEIARRHLATDGSDLSLRAVARELGVVSSAVYRYFASRDELLTALIVDGYDAMGEVVEQADAALARDRFVQRWDAVWGGVRAWAVAHPHEYALLYGTPVPGYAAPVDTNAPAMRVVVAAVSVVRDAVAAGVVESPRDRIPRALRGELASITAVDGFTGVPVPLLARFMTAWATLFGTISFELFGRYTNAVDDLAGYYEHQVEAMARYVGLR